MTRSLNTLFGRMALMSTAVLLAMQLGWLLLLGWERRHQDMDGFSRGMLLALHVANETQADDANVPPAMRVDKSLKSLEARPADDLTAVLHVRRVSAWNLPRDVSLQAPQYGPLVGLARDLSAKLPPGTQIATDGAQPPQLWVRFPDSATWLVLPVDMPTPPNFVREAFSMLMAALILSFLAAWQIQRPLASVVQAARRFGGGERIAPLEGAGPRELRELSASFNDMMRCVNEADDEQVVMLTGTAHDLMTPLTRLKLRTIMMADASERDGMLRDIDSLAHIVQQFLEYARREPDGGKRVEVDAFLSGQFGDIDGIDSETDRGTEGENRPLFSLDLRAGPHFTLPQTSLDRLITNLVENALEYGAPPVSIATSMEGGSWLIRVRDHGAGIEPERIAAATAPFVRLNAARSGDGHCGLGLAIVARLTRDNGGTCVVDNHPDGGLQVQIAIPAGAGQKH
ncbi:MAG TPA: ATP-binding protein [Paraburkholderia sp.]|jgi:two-component system osmolarity sensor histidine kinase EnvZ|nr:ATP-binding protein [Paraburkholderia sp.]